MSTQPITPPPGSQSINQILSSARSHLHRLTPSTLHHELQSVDSPWGPTHVIDIRPSAQRSTEGAVTLPSPSSSSSTTPPSSSPSPPLHKHKIHIIERNVLEWRLDPQSQSRIDEIVLPFGYETRVVVVCSEGYTSSLAARELQRLGLGNATDLEGGYVAWRAFLQGEEGGKVRESC